MEHMESHEKKPVAYVEEDLRDLIPNFVKNRKKDIVDLELALKNNDYQAAVRIGHILKGISASYGFIKLGEYGALLEKNAQLKNPDECLALIRLIEHYMNDVEIVFD